MEEKIQAVVILPSLDPDDNLKQVVENLININFQHIIIVNDGSHEKYNKYFEELLSKPECHVITHAYNKGKGEALKTAFAYYEENFNNEEFYGVVTADADGQHLPKDIKKCAKALRDKKNSLIFGVRNFDIENIPTKSRIGNKATTKIIQVLFGHKIVDTQTGLRGISNEHIKIFKQDKGSRFEYEINMLISALKKDINIEQVEIDTIYYENNRATHFNAVKDSLKIYRVILDSFLKYILSSLSCFGIDQMAFHLFTKVISGDYFIVKSTILARVISLLILRLIRILFLKVKVLKIIYSLLNIVFCA